MATELQQAHDSLPSMLAEGRLEHLEAVLKLMIQTLISHEVGIHSLTTGKIEYGQTTTSRNGDFSCEAVHKKQIDDTTTKFVEEMQVLENQTEEDNLDSIMAASIAIEEAPVNENVATDEVAANEDIDSIGAQTSIEEKTLADRRFMEQVYEGFMNAVRRRDAARKAEADKRAAEELERWLAEDDSSVAEPTPKFEAADFQIGHFEGTSDLKEATAVVVESSLTQDKNGKLACEIDAGSKLEELQFNNVEGKIDSKGLDSGSDLSAREFETEKGACRSEAERLSDEPVEGDSEPQRENENCTMDNQDIKVTNSIDAEQSSSKTAVAHESATREISTEFEESEPASQNVAETASEIDASTNESETRATVGCDQVESFDKRIAEESVAVKQSAEADRKTETCVSENGGGRQNESIEARKTRPENVGAPKTATTQLSKELRETGPASSYKVVHQRVIVRDKPTTEGSIVGTKSKDEIVFGTPYEMLNIPWLKLKTPAVQSSGKRDSEAWMLIDGAHIGLGKLLARLEENGHTLSQKELRELVESLHPTIPDFQPEGSGPIWVVTGGAGKGGLLVRNGEALDSKPLPSKLVTGSTIEELEIVGNRFHYRRIRGEGPDFGWINISLHNKPLIQVLERDEEVG
mmetsp:Transcript_41443/g.65696  ORF Transcript_41443/g.65696 Transcript_41443/m.65696 type:complete len:637 (-) Transcript_41443:200-2110(-)|eukprot:CAMPEP_0169157290 /NCGR_PEP_ID=MMETSP1015-20121227/54504_1 /TAXON_ID=342587 /ORGANISM="Karlodinium micrum, Strain CCMP2283" /LENGTH=636 /DNA_ID=CAMNT_0009228213 /DNA_START=69 /DNA_END=1979 /DNA_ORIENTATION=+